MSASKLSVISRLLVDEDSRLSRGILIAIGFSGLLTGALINTFLPEAYCPVFIWAGVSGFCLLIAAISFFSPAVKQYIYDYASFCHLFMYLAIIYLTYQNNLETSFTHILIVSHIFFAISFRSFAEFTVFAISSLLLFNFLTFYARDPQTNPFLFIIIIAFTTVFAGIHVLLRERTIKGKAEAAHMLRDVLNTSIYGIFLLDENCEHILHQNELASQYLLSTRGTSETNSAQLLYLLGMDKAFLQNRISKNEPGFQEKSYFTFFSQEGAAIQVEIYLSRIHTPESDCFLIKIRDITDRKLQDQHLRESEQQYRILVEKMNDGMMLTDLEETVLFANNRLAEMLGMHKEKMIGRKSYELIPAAANREKIISHSRLRTKGIADQYELKLDRPVGELWLLINGAPYIDASNEVVGTIAIITDITARKHAELKLHEKNQELDSFTYKASHDLKGPLASIMGLSNVAHDEVKDEKALHYFGLIERSTKRLDAILTDLIDLTRLNKTIADLQPVSIESLIRDIIESVKHRMGAEKMIFSVNIEAQREFRTDINLLTSVLQNLIVNSINYHDPGQAAPRIDIRVQEQGGQLLFSIEDNGVGIPEKMKDRVFEMFYRANTKSTGSGLGLYIVKNSIEKLRGEYHLDSEEGVGTKFTFTIPLHLSANGTISEEKSVDQHWVKQ